MVIGSMILGIALLIFLVIRTKLQALVALIGCSMVIGLLAGLDPAKAMGAITSGFGSTLGSIGIVIGFGCIMGRFIECSGKNNLCTECNALFSRAGGGQQLQSARFLFRQSEYSTG